MFKLEGNPWRCWERSTLAGVLNGPEDLLVRVALYNRRTRVYQSEFRWPALDRLGPNDFRGRYAQVTLRSGAVRWSFEVAGDGDQTYLLVRCFEPAAAGDLQIQLETLYQRAGAGRVVTRENEVLAQGRERGWRVMSPSPTAHRVGSTITAPLCRPFVAVIQALPDDGRRLEIRTESERRPGDENTPLTAEERDIAGRVAAARREYLACFSYVPAEFWWAYAAIVYGIGWNMIWAADRGEPVQVCSRDWCVHGNYGEWVLFNWDTFLLIPAAAEYDLELARQIVGPQMAVQTPYGLIPGIASPLGITYDRAMPPVASLGIWKTYQRTKDRTLVEEHYEGLCRYHAWWRRNRDGNGDGLLEWGSHPAAPAHPQWQSHSLWASRYETGMDNHPMWDGVRFNAEASTQEQTDIGLSALNAADAACLARMAELLGRGAEAARYREYAERVGRLVDQQLWCDEIGLWLSRDWNGTWNTRAAPTCFYPLLLPHMSVAHTRRAIDGHLLNPRRFGGRYLLPVSPRDDPAYPEQYYVRGRIWPAQALLVHWALREARQEEAAATLARGCLETMRAEWLDEGHLHENYHAETADGDDTPESDPLYSFGILLPLLAWGHLRDTTLDGTPVRAELETLSEYLDRGGKLRRRIEPYEDLPELR